MLLLFCRRSARRPSCTVEERCAAEERSALSVEHCDVISSVQKQDSPAELKGSSLQPLREPASDRQTVDANDSPESIFIDQCLSDLNNLENSDFLRTNG